MSFDMTGARGTPAPDDDGTIEEREFLSWLSALEARHLSDLRVSEVTRALRALSSAYVERRGDAKGPHVRGALDSAGKRAAFALFYAPLHFLTVLRIVRALGAASPPPRALADIGCGTGVAGAAWALAARRAPAVTGVERNPWAAEEARWTCRQFQIAARVRQGDLTRLPSLRPYDAIVAGWVLNELPPDARRHLEGRLLDAGAHGTRVLIVEPIARRLVPWWDESAARTVAAGGRADEWRFPANLPPLLQTLDRAAGLDHRELTARTLYFGGAGHPV